MTDLTDRMRTCSAHLHTIEVSEVLTDEKMEAIIDARRMLNEAATLLECVADRGEIIPIVNLPPSIKQDNPPATIWPEQALSTLLKEPSSGVWIDEAMGTLPPGPKSRNACPKCDSRANKTVRIKNSFVWLICPACEHAWKR